MAKKVKLSITTISSSSMSIWYTYLSISNYKQISMEDGGVDRIVIDCWQQQG
jgi:hypothetical protein